MKEKLIKVIRERINYLEEETERGTHNEMHTQNIREHIDFLQKLDDALYWY